MLDIPNHGHNPALNCSIFNGTVPQYTCVRQVVSPVFVGTVPQYTRVRHFAVPVFGGGGIVAPRVRRRASLARRHPRAHPRPAWALCPALHDHLLIRLSSHCALLHLLHLFQLGRKASSIPT